MRATVLHKLGTPLGFERVTEPQPGDRQTSSALPLAWRSRYGRDLWTVGVVADVMLEGPTTVLIVPPAPD